jgi:hypothetical protein
MTQLDSEISSGQDRTGNETTATDVTANQSGEHYLGHVSSGIGKVGQSNTRAIE